MHLQGGLLGARLEMLSRYIVSAILGESSLASLMQNWVQMYVWLCACYGAGQCEMVFGMLYEKSVSSCTTSVP